MTATASAAERLAIEDLVNRSLAGVMRKDLALWGNTWADNAFWKIDLLDQPARGRTAIVNVFETIISRMEFVSMTAFVTDVAVDGERATGKAYSQELIFPKSGGVKLLCGCFHDEYVRDGGQWYFQSRIYETLQRTAIVNPPA